MMNAAFQGKVPIESSYWVVPGKLLAGEYPGARREAEAKEKLGRFLDFDIGSFIDLTCQGELVAYDTRLRELAAARSLSVEYHRLPIQDANVPTTEHMQTILNTMDAALSRGLKVYVHCWGGIGRTGTVIGCYLVRHDMNAQDALAHIEQMRVNIPWSDRCRPSPEYPAQKQMVLNWRKDR